MRKIKFRGRSAFDGTVFVGDLVNRRNGLAIRPTDDATMPFGYKVHEDSVEEYTGFDDADGLEIYEGDHLVAAKAAEKAKRRGEFAVKYKVVLNKEDHTWELELEDGKGLQYIPLDVYRAKKYRVIK